MTILLWQKIAATKVAVGLKSWGTLFIKVSAGVVLMNTLNRPYDYVLYPAVIAWKGALLGGIIMIALSFFLDLILIRAYDLGKKDWLSAEELNQKRREIASTKWGEKSLWWANATFFLLLCIMANPATVVICFRKNAFQKRMTRWDWKIFGIAVITSNLWWIWICSLVITLLKYLAEYIAPLRWLLEVSSLLGEEVDLWFNIFGRGLADLFALVGWV